MRNDWFLTNRAPGTSVPASSASLMAFLSGAGGGGSGWRMNCAGICRTSSIWTAGGLVRIAILINTRGGDEEMYIVETLAKNRRLYPGEGKGCKTIGREWNRSKASVKKRRRGKETSQRYKRRQAVDPVLEADRGWLLSTLEADRKAPVSYRRTARKL